MKKLVSLTFTVILFFVSQLWAAAWDQNLPLQSAEDKAEAFLKIRAMIPSMADGAVRYAFDPITLFDHQLKIEQIVSGDSQYQNLKSAHKNLVEFALYDSNTQPPVASHKEISWKEWQARSAQWAQALGLNSEAQVMSEIHKTLQSPLLGKSQGIVVGLSNLIPGPQKKEFFAASLEVKVEMLKNSLPAEVISHGFTPAKLGWVDTELSKDEIISRLQSASALEQRLNVLLVHHYSQQQALSAPKDYLKKWTLEASQQKSLEQWFSSNVAKLIPTDMPQAEASLIVREIPPAVAMFRGFAGNDCSTLCSFPFVNSPNEYTFLIYDSKGGIKGYAQGTRVLVDGKSTFFLHTIAGPRVSKSDAISVIKAFVQEKQSFGFNEVLLPPMAKVESLINFMPVREAIQEVIAASTKKLHYQDAELRTNFKNIFQISKSYDDAASNPLAHQIDESKLGAPVKLIRKEAQGLDKIQTHMDRNSLIGMLLTMGKDLSKNGAMIKALTPHTGVSFETVESLIKLSDNRKKLPSEELFASFDQALKDAGFIFKEGYFKKNLSLVAEGLLRSPDVVANLELGEKVLMNLLEQREFSTVEDFLLSHPHLFRSGKLTVAFLRAFYNDVHEAIFRQPEALIVALGVNPAVILQNKEILEKLVLSPKALNALVIQSILKPQLTKLMDKQAGQAILEGRQKLTDRRNQAVRQARHAKTDAEYHKVIESFSEQLKEFPPEVSTMMEKNLRLMTVDQAIAISTGEEAAWSLRKLFDDGVGLKDPETLRALRKLLPAALKTDTAAFNPTIAIAASLRTVSPDTAEFDHIVTSALSQRSDAHNLPTRYKTMLPDLNWTHITALRCEAVFR